MSDKALNIIVPEVYAKSNDDIIFKIAKRRTQKEKVLSHRTFILPNFNLKGAYLNIFNKMVTLTHFYKCLIQYGLSRNIPYTLNHKGEFECFVWTPPYYQGHTIWSFKYKNMECSFTGSGYDIIIRVHTLDTDESDALIKALLTEIADSYIPEVVPKTINIYTVDFVHQQYTWVSHTTRPQRDISTIYIDEDIKNKLVKGLKDFYASSSLYDRYGITWKYVQLFHGPPGSGKTSTAIALASIFNKGISKLTVTPHLNGQDMEKLIKTLHDNTFLLIEDVDSLFTKREGVSSLDFSTILNCLDGVVSKRGMVVIMTTNHKDKLDPAFLRPGRVDQDIHFPLPGVKELRLCLETLAPEFKHEHDEFIDRYSEKMTIPLLQRHLFECIKSEKKSILDYQA